MHIYWCTSNPHYLKHFTVLIGWLLYFILIVYDIFNNWCGNFESLWSRQIVYKLTLRSIGLCDIFSPLFVAFSTFFLPCFDSHKTNVLFGSRFLLLLQIPCCTTGIDSWFRKFFDLFWLCLQCYSHAKWAPTLMFFNTAEYNAFWVHLFVFCSLEGTKWWL